MSVLEGKNILLGVTGSIAAYKSIILLRLLKREGADVQVIFSDSANNFVTQLTFSTLSEKKVLTDFLKTMIKLSGLIMWNLQSGQII